MITWKPREFTRLVVVEGVLVENTYRVFWYHAESFFSLDEDQRVAGEGSLDQFGVEATEELTLETAINMAQSQFLRPGDRVKMAQEGDQTAHDWLDEIGQDNAWFIKLIVRNPIEFDLFEEIEELKALLIDARGIISEWWVYLKDHRQYGLFADEEFGKVEDQFMHIMRRSNELGAVEPID